MKIFIDANILVAVINKEYPLFNSAARVLSWATASKHQLQVTTISLAITSYFSEKKHGAKSSKKRMAILAEHFTIIDCGANATMLALNDQLVEDFEDGLQYYAAVDAKADYIVTENVRDYYFSKVEVLTAADFLQMILSK